MQSPALSIEEIRQKIADDQPIVIRDDRWLNETVDYAIGVLHVGLAFIGKEGILDQMAYCLRELVDNARKANLKRVYFEDQGLNILDPNDYRKGMEGFRDSVNARLSHYLDILHRMDCAVEVVFSVKLSALTITVANDATAVETERKRILHKMSKAAVYNSIVEVMEDIQDSSESAGLGLVTAIMVLRKIGVPDRQFSFEIEKKRTVFRMEVPLSLVTDEETESIEDALIEEIDTIPQFPKSIMILQKTLRDPKVDLQKVAQIIRRDPSLTLEVLRMSNSAYYRRLNKITNIEQAVGILGLRGVGVILQSFGAKKALEGKYSGKLLDNLWEHSGRIAGIASILCKKFAIPDEEEEIAYVGGLLHDIGKIVLEGRHPGTFAAMKEICAQKRTSAAVVEDLIAGVNHALLGARMAERWNIPEAIADVIRFSRTPLSAPEPSRRAAVMIYLAHLVYFVVHGEAKEYEATGSVLEEFGLDPELTLNELIRETREAMADL